MTTEQINELHHVVFNKLQRIQAYTVEVPEAVKINKEIIEIADYIRGLSLNEKEEEK